MTEDKGMNAMGGGNGCIVVILLVAMAVVFSSTGLRSLSEGYRVLVHEDDIVYAVSLMSRGIGILFLLLSPPMTFILGLLMPRCGIQVGFAIGIIGLLCIILAYVAGILAS